MVATLPSLLMGQRGIFRGSLVADASGERSVTDRCPRAIERVMGAVSCRSQWRLVREAVVVSGKGWVVRFAKRTVVLALVAIALLAAGCGVSSLSRSPSSTLAARGHGAAAMFASGCAGSYGGLTQAMDGRISGCLQVGPLRAGPRTVVLEQLLDFRGAKPPLKLPPHLPKRIREEIFPREPAVALTVSPASGRPGTTVRITGRLSGRRPRGAGHPNFCWDGCRFGLQYEGVAIHWTSPRTFRARLIVPGAPWIEGNPVRAAPLVPGTYPIALQCLVLGKACAWERVEGVADFHLRGAVAPSWCPAPSSCARLQVMPRAALPGDVVRVTGFAPLVSITGSDQPFAFQLEVLKGRPRGPEVRFGTFKAVRSALLGRAAFDALAPASFASLGDTTPIAELSAGLSPISAQPGAASTVAWCAPGAVNVSSAGATTSIPTTAASATLTRMGFQASGGSPLRCDAVSLAGPVADPAAVVAVAFAAAPAKYGGPPFYEVALVTADRGQTWTAVPVPAGASALSFGGFRYQGGGVEAVFASATPDRKAPAYPNLDPRRPLAELNTSGGTSWQPAPLGCPAAGPCVTLGPYLQDDCAMNEVTQPLLRSTDGGVRWSQPPLPDQAQACAETELAATSARRELLVDSISRFPLQATTDGGATWHDIGLPPAPGEQSYGLGEGPGGITALPDGDLLLSGGQGYRGGWELLRPRSRAWCAVRTPPAQIQALRQRSSLTLIGRELWWLTGAYNTPPAAHHDAFSTVSC